MGIRSGNYELAVLETLIGSRYKRKFHYRAAELLGPIYIYIKLESCLFVFKDSLTNT